MIIAVAAELREEVSAVQSCFDHGKEHGEVSVDSCDIPHRMVAISQLLKNVEYVAKFENNQLLALRPQRWKFVKSIQRVVEEFKCDCDLGVNVELQMNDALEDDYVFADSSALYILQCLLHMATAFSPEDSTICVQIHRTSGIEKGECQYQFVLSHRSVVEINAEGVYKALKDCVSQIMFFNDESSVSEKAKTRMQSMNVRLELFVAANLILLMDGDPLQFVVDQKEVKYVYSLPFTMIADSEKNGDNLVERPEHIHQIWRPMVEQSVLPSLQLGKVSVCQGSSHVVCNSSDTILPSRIDMLPPKSRTPRILVVDDSLISQRILAQALSRLGFLTDVADNGRAALDKLVHVPCLFDAVVMDVIMPVMDGFTATRICRQELNLQIPILILSADVLPDTRQSMLGVGATAFIVKPAKIVDVLSELHVCGLTTTLSTNYLATQDHD